MRALRGAAEPFRDVYVNEPKANSVFCDNTVTNTKYSWLSFIPKNLLEQFRCGRGATAAPAAGSG